MSSCTAGSRLTASSAPDARCHPRQGHRQRAGGVGMHRRVLAGVAAIVALALGAPAGASAWAPASTATIHPGVQVFTAGAQCTANFVFTSGGATYLGQAAHCSGTGQATDTDGCTSGSLPLGTPVEVTGATRPGALAYNSWLTMQD